VVGGAAAFVLVVGVNNCTFPDYNFSGPAAGSAGAGDVGGTTSSGSGSGGTAGGGNSGGTDIDDAGAAGMNGGSAGDGAAGEAGSAGSAGSAGEPCVFPAPVNYPAHCFNKNMDEDESGMNCGGSTCAPCSSNQTCTKASDCLSQQCSSNKTCVPSLILNYLPIDTSDLTATPKFKLEITYPDTSKSMTLSDFRIRYYYNHKKVTEPIIGLDAQTTINNQDISTAMMTAVHRFPPGPMDSNKGLITDSYLEISYNDTRTVLGGTKFVITQDLVPGNNEELFDQNSHYSFSKTAGANTSLTVYRGSERIWGVEPPMAFFPECAFSQGANINGPALTISGESLLAESEAGFTFNGAPTYSSTNALAPAVDKPTTTLLGTGRTLSAGESIVWPVPNGKYWAYAWLTSIASDSGTLSFNTQAADKFVGKTTTSAPITARWALIGPYAVQVTDKSLQLTVDDTVHLGGVKLYEAAR